MTNKENNGPVWEIRSELAPEEASVQVATDETPGVGETVLIFNWAGKLALDIPAADVGELVIALVEAADFALFDILPDQPVHPEKLAEIAGIDPASDSEEDSRGSVRVSVENEHDKRVAAAIAAHIRAQDQDPIRGVIADSSLMALARDLGVEQQVNELIKERNNDDDDL